MTVRLRCSRCGDAAAFEWNGRWVAKRQLKWPTAAAWQKPKAGEARGVNRSEWSYNFCQIRPGGADPDGRSAPVMNLTISFGATDRGSVRDGSCWALGWPVLAEFFSGAGPVHPNRKLGDQSKAEMFRAAEPGRASPERQFSCSPTSAFLGCLQIPLPMGHDPAALWPCVSLEANPIGPPAEPLRWRGLFGPSSVPAGDWLPLVQT